MSEWNGTIDCADGAVYPVRGLRANGEMEALKALEEVAMQLEVAGEIERLGDSYMTVEPEGGWSAWIAAQRRK